MKKCAFVVLAFCFFGSFFFNFSKEAAHLTIGNETSKNIINKDRTTLGSNINQALSSPSFAASSIPSASSSHAASSSPAFSDAYKPWEPVFPSQEIQNKVDNVIGDFLAPVTRAFIKVDPGFLEKIEADGIYEIPIPDAADADMHVINIEKKDGLTNVVGHLSGYPESYYIGFSYDKEGHIYGEITTERSNYSIKTYYNQPVVIKVLPEMEKTQRNDF